MRRSRGLELAPLTPRDQLFGSLQPLDARHVVPQSPVDQILPAHPLADS